MRSVFPAILVVALASPPAYAADPPASPSPSSENAAAAESLFQDARKLIAEKRYAEACPKFAASQRLAPAVGTLLNLGDCYEKLGKTASAWATYVDAASAAQRLNRPDRERTARALAATAEAKLSRLTLRVDKALAGLAGLVVKRDGVVVEDAALGVAVPLDPGRHELEATAPGKRPWTKTIDVAEKDRLDVLVPALENEREHLPSALLDDSALVGAAEPESADPGKTRRIIGIGLVGLGVVGVGAGSFFGLKANSSWSDAQGHCTGNRCNDEGVSLASDAKTAGNISTVAFISGAVALATGVVLILTAPSKRASPSSSSQAAPRGSF